MRRFTTGMTLLVLASVVQPSPTNADGIKDFEKLHKELTCTKEAWQTLPWQLSLLDAQRLAAKENKPIYMLCRSGHPLGCV